MKKQFVWIMTDSTRADMLGCYGNAAMHTPHNYITEYKYES